MRGAVPLAGMLLLATILTGCTSDGYLGEIDPEAQAQGAQARVAAIWSPAAAAHVSDVRIGARTLVLEGDLAPVQLASATLLLPPPEESPPLPPGMPDTMLRPSRPAHFALGGAILDGERGWLAFNASSPPTLTAREGTLALDAWSLHAEGDSLEARLRSGFGVILPHPGCFETAHPHEPASCAAWREARPPPPPRQLENLTRAPVEGLTLAPRLDVEGLGLTFFPAEGEPRPLARASVDATRATLYAVHGAGHVGLGVSEIALPLAARDAPTRWTGNLTVHASPPTGSLHLGGGDRLLAPHNEATITLRNGGAFTLVHDREWTLATDAAQLVDVRTGPTPRLEAKLRLAPETLTASGPAGNATRVNLILAETSRGADAHVSGYRIDGSVKARYVGWEPFAMTEALFEVLNDTEGPIEAAMVAPLGIMIPFVAFGEAFAALFQTLFPPSLEGTVGAGEAKVVTFDLQMPAEPRDVTILIEARNAEPVRATLRLVPT